jgi:hypothetical protein
MLGSQRPGRRFTVSPLDRGASGNYATQLLEARQADLNALSELDFNPFDNQV